MRRVILTTVAALAGAATMAGAAEARLVAFSTPSGNIGCIGETGGGGPVFVRCDIRNSSYRPPAQPASCDFDWGNGFSVSRLGRARWNCVSDSALTRTNPLAYGRSRSIGGIVCRSSKAGLRCTNRQGHGFFLSRQRAFRF